MVDVGGEARIASEGPEKSAGRKRVNPPRPELEVGAAQLLLGRGDRPVDFGGGGLPLALGPPLLLQAFQLSGARS